MVKKDIDTTQTQFVYTRLDEGIPEDDSSRFVVQFVDMFYPVLDLEETVATPGAPSFPKREMFKLVIYGFYRGVTSIEMLAEMAQFHQIYRYVSGDIKPSARTIRRCITKYGGYFKILRGCTLIFSQEVNLTSFNHVSVDGSIKKADNNRFNVIHKDDIEILLDYYEGEFISADELNNLRKPAKKFIIKEDINREDKIELLHEMKTQLTMSGQDTIPVNDIEARWMHNKDGNSQISYNIQSAVDTTTKLICAVNITQNPTDHDELPEIVEKTIENTKTQPKIVSADTGYHNTTSIEYLHNKGIKGAIPDRKQTHKQKNQINPNPYHKDHFKYNYKDDTFTCPEKQTLYFKYQYQRPAQKENKPDRIERKYMNYEACKNCTARKKCTKSSHRIISEFANENTLKMKEYMDSQEGQNEYKKRGSTVEAPFGILKIFYDYNNIRTHGITQTENIMNLCALTHNIKRLYNIKHNILDDITQLDNFLEKIATQFETEIIATIK